MSHLSGSPEGPALTLQASCSDRDSTILHPHPQSIIRVSRGSPTIVRPGTKPLLSCSVSLLLQKMKPGLLEELSRLLHKASAVVPGRQRKASSP